MQTVCLILVKIFNMDGIWIIFDILMKNEYMVLIILSFLLVILVTLLICFTTCLRKHKKYHKTNKNKLSDIENGQRKKFEEPWRWAGKQGENEANWIIQSVLREDDYLFTNVEISYEGKETEIDDVIVNKYGVFIIEVKNYRGLLLGNEEDFEWKKYKDDGYGNVFMKAVKNPIRQVKRQVYILAKNLEFSGVWVEGYVLLLQDNSPIKNESVLGNKKDIDKAIHTFGRNRLNKQNVDSIRRILSACGNEWRLN